MTELQMSKATKRRLRELAGIAYERELRKALQPVEQALADMHAGKRNAFEVSEVIHQFHQKPARELWIRYARSSLEMAIHSALFENVITPEEIPEEARQWFVERVEYYRALQNSDTDEDDAIENNEGEALP